MYAQAVDYDGCRVVLHTVYYHAEPHEYTDIVFAGVIAYHVEQQAFHGHGVAANVVFDAEESDAAFVLGRYSEILAAAKNYGWPVLQYDGLADLAARLIAGGTKCYEVHSTCGLSGFVFAASMEFRRRSSRARITDAEPLS